MRCLLGFHRWRERQYERWCLRCGRIEDSAYDGVSAYWRLRPPHRANPEGLYLCERCGELKEGIGPDRVAILCLSHLTTTEGSES